MNAKYSILTALAACSLVACEDYTEHHFGDREDLYKPTQVNNHHVVMTPAHYEAVANNTANQERALKAAQDSSIYFKLLDVNTQKYFTDEIAPEEYLPAVLKDLVGSNAYYAMTEGSSIKVSFNKQVELDEAVVALQGIPSVTTEGTFTPATINELNDAINEQYPNATKDQLLVVNYQYSPVELPEGNSEEEIAPQYELVEKAFPGTGKYLLVPVGLNVAIQYNEGKSYGYPVGVDIVRQGEKVILSDQNTEDAAFTITQDAKGCLLLNGAGQYLFMKGTYNSFNYTEDLSTLEAEQWPYFTINANNDFTFDITNTGTNKVILWGTNYNSAGAYADRKGQEGYLGIQLYQYVEKPAKAKTRAAKNYNASAVYRFNGNQWVEHSISKASLSVVTPETYSQLGKDYISKPQHVLPIYLQNHFPYAEEEDVVVLVYNAKKEIAAAKYIYTGEEWKHLSNVEEQQVTFSLENDVWVAKGDYLNQTLTELNSTEPSEILNTYGWSIENEGTTGDLSFVWQATTRYGFKASAFKSGTKYAVKSWIISPYIDLKKARKPVFIVDQAWRFAAEPRKDFLQILISTDYAGPGNRETAKWIDVTEQFQGEWGDGSNWDFHTITLDLTPYVGQSKVTIAFRYISTDTVAPTWEFKNVICREAE